MPQSANRSRIRDHDLRTAFVGKVVVALDVAVRCGMVVVAYVLIRDVWGEPEPNSDGPPGGLLVIPLLAYIVWNGSMIGRTIARWTGRSLSDAQYLASVGGLSALRLVWLLPLAGEAVNQRRNGLLVLTVGSVICTIAALVLAIDRAGGIYQPPEQRRHREVPSAADEPRP
jgi:hypothetical protein